MRTAALAGDSYASSPHFAEGLQAALAGLAIDRVYPEGVPGTRAKELVLDGHDAMIARVRGSSLIVVHLGPNAPNPDPAAIRQLDVWWRSVATPIWLVPARLPEGSLYEGRWRTTKAALRRAGVRHVDPQWAPGEGELSPDGIHLTAPGYVAFGEASGYAIADSVARRSALATGLMAVIGAGAAYVWFRFR